MDSQNFIGIGPKMAEIHQFFGFCLGLYLVTFLGHRAFQHKITKTRFLAFVLKELRGVPSVSSTTFQIFHDSLGKCAKYSINEGPFKAFIKSKVKNFC